MRTPYETIEEVATDFEIHVTNLTDFNRKGRIVNLMLQGTIPNRNAKVYKVTAPEVEISDATIIAEANKQVK